jgi:hypothetical protein
VVVVGKRLKTGPNLPLRASLGTTFSQGIFISPRKNKLISYGKIEIPWENGVPKLDLIYIKGAADCNHQQSNQQSIYLPFFTFSPRSRKNVAFSL